MHDDFINEYRVMKKAICIFLCCSMSFILLAQKNVSFNTVERIEMYYLDDFYCIDLKYQAEKTKITVEDMQQGGLTSIILPDSSSVELLQLVKAAFFDGSPTRGKKSDAIESGHPVVGITCYAKGKVVYSNRICHEIDYQFSPEYERLIDVLLSYAATSKN